MEKHQVLNSHYIIDGIPQDLTPKEMLDRCPAAADNAGLSADNQILDEIVDPVLQGDSFDSWKIKDYLDAISNSQARSFPVAFSAQYTKILIARTLIDTLWNEGRFRLGDLQIDIEWLWDTTRIGNMAAFYASAQSAGEYIDDLSLKLSGYNFCECAGCGLRLSASAAEDEDDDEDLGIELPFRTAHPHFSDTRAVPSGFVDDPDSWLIYVPMDGCDFRLGGSLLTQVMRQGCEVAPDLCDPDYFIDCFEVLREMVEDGVIIAAETVGDGGLLNTLRKMADASGTRTGARISLTDIISACNEQDIVRILFSEVPGAVIQIRDADYDYVDAELVLQDVIFFPLGHPVHGKPEIKVDAGGKTGIQSILESLIRSQSSEGED